MPSIISATTTNGLSTSADNSGSLQLATNNGTTAVTIDTSQRVLIGATSASGFDSGADNLIVGAGSGSNGITIYSGNTSTAGINFADGTTGSDIYAGGITYNHNTNNLDFSTTDGSGRMRIDSSGQVFVKPSTGGSYTVGDSGFYSDGGFGNNLIMGNTYGAGKGYINFYNGGTGIGGINAATASTVVYLTTSDYRLKENIAPMTGALAKIQALKPCTYKWKLDGAEGQGFIAHELQEIVPDCVFGKKDAVETYTDKDGNEQTRIKPQGVDTSFLVATLTAAIQELKAELDATKAEVQALKGVA